MGLEQHWQTLVEGGPVVWAAVAVVLATIVYFFAAGFESPKSFPALNPDEWIPYPLIEVEKISHDVRRFRFALKSKDQVLGLPIGQHISLKYIEGETEVQRSYTPVSSDDDKGFVDFVVKVYYKAPPKFPDGGKMSQHLDNLKIGETILMRGPKGHLSYKGSGVFTISKSQQLQQHRKKSIGMIAGGTGITPMLQVIRAIVKNPADETRLWLIFANQTEEDILLRKELEELALLKTPSGQPRLNLWYTLDRPPTDGSWKYSTGFINTEMCRNHLPAPSSSSDNNNETMIWICGPPPMIKYACEPALNELGFKPEDWFCF